MLDMTKTMPERLSISEICFKSCGLGLTLGNSELHESPSVIAAETLMFKLALSLASRALMAASNSPSAFL